MSILSAIKEAKHDNNNLQDLALLPQVLIMQMAQRGEIDKELVPLIISKKAELIETTARNQALANSGQTPPTVIEQKMMQVAQAENPAPAPQMMPQQMAQMPAPQLPEEVGIAQNPVPPMQMAGGGIIAFAPGGDVDDDDDDESYEDYLDELQRARLESMILRTYQDSGAGSGAGISYIESMPKRTTEEVKAPKKGKEKYGIEDLTAYVLKKESGGRRYDKEGNLLTSPKGALGEMQVMPLTIQDPGFGVRPAKDRSPDEIARVGRDYLSAMMNRYGDPKLAAIAYNMGPGATDKWLASGANPNKLPAETRGYIAGLAGGGEVKQFQAGGTMGGFGDENYDLDTLRIQEAEAARKQQEYADKYNFLQQSAPDVAARMKPPVMTEKDTDKMVGYRAQGKPSGATEESIGKFLKDRTEVGATPSATVRGPAPAVMSPEDKLFAQMQEALAKRELRLEAARKQDPWLAGLAAGLGMLGGTSPYAMVNIGQGGGQGVAQYAASQRARAAEEAGIGALQNKMYSSAMTGALRRDLQAQTRGKADEDRELRRATAKAEYIQKRLKNLPMTEQMLASYRLKQVDGDLTPKERRRLEHYEKEMEKIELDANRRFGSEFAGFSATERKG